VLSRRFSSNYSTTTFIRKLRLICEFRVKTSVECDRLCGLVVRVPGYRAGGPGSVPVATRFSEKLVWNEVLSVLKENVAAPV
jgi:hypothetical protein